MPTIAFPPPFVHHHPPSANVNELLDSRRTFGQVAADTVARVMGSWRFIIGQSALLACWVVLNLIGWSRHWDPYPFILMNLVLSLQAAYAAPIIMMSQNRQAMRDRLEAHNDFLVDQQAETEIRAILDHLAAHTAALEHLLMVVESQNGHPNREVPGA
jgi:uncharacterized membrane protein